MDGKFKEEQKLDAAGTVVNLEGPLGNADGLSVDVYVIVMQGAVVAQGKGKKSETDPKMWSATASVLNSPPPLTPGAAIAYAVAVAMGDGDLSSYHWHGHIELKP